MRLLLSHHSIPCKLTSDVLVLTQPIRDHCSRPDTVVKMSHTASNVSAAALEQNLNITLLQELSAAVDGHAAAATFACGGSVPISECFAGAYDAAEEPMYPEITIRWDSNDSSKVSKLAFPLQDQDALMSLLAHCQPATFGLGGKDVLDESYRKASKLDRSEFSTDFHPHDCGIVDSIQQILLPSVVKGGQGIGIGPHGVRAELYKLNVPKTDFMNCKTTANE